MRNLAFFLILGQKKTTKRGSPLTFVESAIQLKTESHKPLEHLFKRILPKNLTQEARGREDILVFTKQKYWSTADAMNQASPRVFFCTAEKLSMDVFVI